MNHFSTGLWHATKSGFYMTSSDDQLSGWTKKELQSTFQSQTCTKKCSWSLIGGLLPVWSTTAFWIPAKPLHLRSRSMRCTKNYNACSWHWSRERTQFFSTTVPHRTSHNQHFKNWTRLRTRWQRSRWMWSISLSMDTSGIYPQTQKCMQNTSWEWTGVPDQRKRIYRTTQNSVGQRN